MRANVLILFVRIFAGFYIRSSSRNQLLRRSIPIPWRRRGVHRFSQPLCADRDWGEALSAGEGTDGHFETFGINHPLIIHRYPWYHDEEDTSFVAYHNVSSGNSTRGTLFYLDGPRRYRMKIRCRDIVAGLRFTTYPLFLSRP